MAKDSKLVVGLDIGTTKVCAIVAEVNGDAAVDIIGVGQSPSRGLRKGVVVNIDATVDSVRRAVEDAELMAGVEIRSAFVGIAGGHIKGLNSRGVIAISGKNREVTRQDVERVIDAAKAVALPVDREVIHILPQEFIIDDQAGIKQPLGMCGIRLEAEVHIVTGAVASAQNIIKCANKAGLEVQDIVLQQLASSEATLSAEEKELGCILVDVGGGTTDVAVFVEGSIYHTAVLAVGGDTLTNDIAIGLRTPRPEAESLKRKYGCALAALVRPDDKIEVPSVGGRRPRVLARQTLCEIVQPRLDELFSMVDREVRRAGYAGRANGGVVVTGGSSIMEGVPELAEQIFDMPVRRGIPRGVGGPHRRHQQPQVRDRGGPGALRRGPPRAPQVPEGHGSQHLRQGRGPDEGVVRGDLLARGGRPGTTGVRPPRPRPAPEKGDAAWQSRWSWRRRKWHISR